MKNKKGLSVVIATLLLTMISILLVAVFFVVANHAVQQPKYTIYQNVCENETNLNSLQDCEVNCAYGLFLANNLSSNTDKGCIDFCNKNYATKQVCNLKKVNNATIDTSPGVLNCQVGGGCYGSRGLEVKVPSNESQYEIVYCSPINSTEYKCGNYTIIKN